VAECRGCGAEIEFVRIRVKVKGEWQEKHHPLDSPRRKVAWGRVTYNPDEGVWEILDARLLKRVDGTIDVRAGQSWPGDGGAYESHFDTCPDVAERRRIKRKGVPRTDEEQEARDLEEANAHIPRCRKCFGGMDEYLSADEAWRDHPSCDDRHTALTVEERNRLTGRNDRRPSQVAVPVAVVVAGQQEAAKAGLAARLRRAQEDVDTAWQQTEFGESGDDAT
jgi:hypothetical protein